MDCISNELVEDQPDAQELVAIISASSSNTGDAFQIDFIRQGVTVVRKRISERSWKKITQGEWDQNSVSTLIARGLLVLHAKSTQGWEVYPRPELLGAV